MVNWEKGRQNKGGFLLEAYGEPLFYRPGPQRCSSGQKHFWVSGATAKTDITRGMFNRSRALRILFAAGSASLVLLGMPAWAQANQASTRDQLSAPVEAQFRGCESAGWCRFWIESMDPLAQSLYRVRPNGAPHVTPEAPLATALRDRLNVLLSDMIHQAKHIVLHDLHQLDDGTYSATVTVNGIDLAADPILVELNRKIHATAR
jgi:hypothetical protein